MEIGKVIRRVRKAKRATLEDIALAAGTDAANLSRVERGRQRFTPELLENVATALEIPISALYLIAEQTLTPYQAKGSKAELAKAAGRLEDIVVKFMLLSPENQQFALEFIDLTLKKQQSATRP